MFVFLIAAAILGAPAQCLSMNIRITHNHFTSKWVCALKYISTCYCANLTTCIVLVWVLLNSAGFFFNEVEKFLHFLKQVCVTKVTVTYHIQICCKYWLMQQPLLLHQRNSGEIRKNTLLLRLIDVPDEHFDQQMISKKLRWIILDQTL